MLPPSSELPRSLSASDGTGQASPSGLALLQRWLDWLLMLDVFLVLAGALWFGLGVVGHVRGQDVVLTAFQRLWMPLFQPALGVLMAAALLSGGLGWWRRRAQR
jgi:hypothetical protein